MIRWDIRQFDILPSTQDLTKEQAEQGAPQGIVIQANKQTAGHGRHGRTWVSEEGNLYLSFILHPDMDLRDLGQIGIITSLAIADTIRKISKSATAIKLKWPNDVMLDGRKCAGILLETSLRENKHLDWLVVGVGINITSAPSEAAQIAPYLEKPRPLNEIRDIFLADFAALYEEWSMAGFMSIREKWLSLAHKQGESIQVKIGENHVTGLFSGIDMYGNMLLTTGAGDTKTIAAGEIYS